MTHKTGEVLSSQENSIWFSVFISEFTVIFIINACTLIIFARNRQLLKRTTYLIINLTVADLLVGAVTGPLEIYYAETSDFSWQGSIISFFYNAFPVSSLANLSLISLERLHATLHPFKHCSIRKRVYFTAISCSWLLAFVLACMDTVFYLFLPAAYWYAWASHIVLTLVTLTISYVIIAVKVKSNPLHRHFGAVVSNRKLSVTLFIVTIVSILTTLPWAIWAIIPHTIWIEMSHAASIDIKYAVLVLFCASSIVNPVVYAIRMQQFRQAVKELICKRTPVSISDQPIELDKLSMHVILQTEDK